MSQIIELSKIIMLSLKKIKALEERILLLENKNTQPVVEVAEIIPVISKADMPEMITCSLCKKEKHKRQFKSTDSRCIACRTGKI